MEQNGLITQRQPKSLVIGELPRSTDLSKKAVLAELAYPYGIIMLGDAETKYLNSVLGPEKNRNPHGARKNLQFTPPVADRTPGRRPNSTLCGWFPKTRKILSPPLVAQQGYQFSIQ